MGQNKKLKPFGEIPESFKGLKEEGVYYVDKTGFIPYLIQQKRKICVVTRPRRFGKTLMLRTLETFFEYRLDDDGKPVDNRRYFEGLKVMEAGDEVLREMGQYPVISISFKDVWGDSYDKLVAQLRGAVRRACEPHESLLKNSGVLSVVQLETFQGYLDRVASEDDLTQFLEIMIDWLYKATKRQSVILLDEYDVPLQKAAIYDIHNPGSKLFDETVGLIGKFISAGFKSNNNLAYGIIAGCMRVAKESIFTGMNNPGVITVLDDIPEEFWGFTEGEVCQMLSYYGIEDQIDALKHWYDGYYYSGREVYNPWSLLNAIRGLVNGYGDNAIQSYWAMTSSNDIIDDLIQRYPKYREELAKMMNGATRHVPIYKDLSYRDLKIRPDAIWSIMLFTGYLKSLNHKKNDDNLWEADVTVPNIEIRSVMKSAMNHWWNDIQIHGYNSQMLLHALISCDIATAECELKLVLSESTSVFDYNEAFYHGMLVGLLGTVAVVRSNDEYGEGRPDVVALAEDTGVILEVKCVTPKELDLAKQSNPDVDEDDIVDSLCDEKLKEAEKQIIDRKYVRSVLRHEPIARSVVSYAVCFCKKWCVMRKVIVK